MVVDVITFNGEKELFEIRYNILKDFVDEFRVIEFDQTFSGKPKEVKFLGDQSWPKVKHYLIKEDIWSKYYELALASPNTEYGKGAEHWIREFCQKESIKDCLVDLEDNDTVFIGDCDEIWNPTLAQYEPKRVHKLGLLVYSYYLNNKSSEQFYGNIWTQHKDIKNKTLNHVRSQSNYHTLIPNGGWHFTSMGGHDKVRDKLTDSYTKDSYANDWVMNNLEDNIKNKRDFMGRDFTYKIDESQWPKYLTDNREKYKHLLWPNGESKQSTNQT